MLLVFRAKTAQITGVEWQNGCQQCSTYMGWELHECGVFVVKYTNSYFILVQSWGILIDDGNVSHFISSVECVLYKIATNRTRVSTGDMNIDKIKIFTNMCSLPIRMSFNSLRPCYAHKRQ